MRLNVQHHQNVS